MTGSRFDAYPQARLLDSEPRLAELDLNPIILYPAAQKVIALDALIAVQ